MLVYHITEDVHSFSLSHDRTVLDALECLREHGLVQHCDPVSPTRVRGVTFAVLDSDLHAAVQQYWILQERWGMVVIDLSDCEDEDYLQGKWLPGEVVIVNPTRARIVARVQVPPCDGCGDVPGHFGTGQCFICAGFDQHPVDYRTC